MKDRLKLWILLDLLLIILVIGEVLYIKHYIERVADSSVETPCPTWQVDSPRAGCPKRERNLTQ